jgi:hypothetical protein
MTLNSSLALPAEVIARLLQWTTDAQWLQVRLLSQKWRSAVVCLMEGELCAQTSSDGIWKPPLLRTVVRRLLLVSAPSCQPKSSTASVAFT